MKTRNLLLAGLLLLGGACKPEPRRAETAPAPTTSEEYTQAIIREVQKAILSTDQQLREYPPQSRELPAEEGRPPSTLQLWTEAGNPVRLDAAEGQGRERRVSSYYFANNELFFASGPQGRFIFIDRKLKYWLDESWKSVQASEQQREEQEAALLRQAEEYLSRFTAPGE